MASAAQISTKRLAINKANTQMVIIVAAAALVSVFCLVASKAVFSQNRYQAHVITAKEAAHKQLQKNLTTFDTLQGSYKAFNAQSPNAIGGQSDGTGPNSGTNSTIVLDALPYTYDFPALTSSIEKILSDNGLKISSITGTDDQLNQTTDSSPTPEPVPMDFSFSISNANYQAITLLVDKLQSSIRPIQIDTLDVSGGGSNITATVNAHTYYQPIKNVSITKKVVK